MHHIPVEGIVSGFLHAHVVGSLISLRPAVGGRLHLFRLPVLYRRVITMLQLRLLRWMLCRRSSSGCLAAHAIPTLTDALPSWLLLVGRSRQMLCRRGAVLVDAWPPSCCYRVLVSDLVLVQFV